MSIITDCPSCRRQLRIPDELVGQQVKCPTCNETFALIGDQPDESDLATSEIPTVELEDQAASPPDTEASQAKQESSVSESAREKTAGDDVPPCPYCGEPMAKSAGRCRYCGENLGEPEEDDDRPWEREFRPYRGVRRDSEPHRGSLILTLGIVSIVLSATTLLGVIGLPVGIAAWLMGRRDLKRMRANQMDPQGYGLTHAGFICGIVGTVLGSLCSLYCLGQLFLMGFMMLGASRMTPSSPVPVPKKAPAKPGQGAAIPVFASEQRDPTRLTPDRAPCSSNVRPDPGAR